MQKWRKSNEAAKANDVDALLQYENFILRLAHQTDSKITQILTKNAGGIMTEKFIVEFLTFLVAALLTMVFYALKMFHIIDWSWFWIFSPLLIWAGVCVIIVADASDFF